LEFERLLHYFLYTVYAIFVINAVILSAGLLNIIFFGWIPSQLYAYAFAVVVLEPIAIFLLWTRDILGLRTGIKEMKYSSEEKINEYMKKLISSGSTLDIVSGRLHWVSEDESVKQKIIERAKNADINIYLPEMNEIAQELQKNGLSIHIVPSLRAPHGRFTLVDMNRPGSAVLAVGAGRIPNFRISEFYENNHPQVVALARDYIQTLQEE
jgi:hypothetical protein